MILEELKMSQLAARRGHKPGAGVKPARVFMGGLTEILPQRLQPWTQWGHVDDITFPLKLPPKRRAFAPALDLHVDKKRKQQ